MWAASGGSIPKFVTSILSSVLPTLFTVDAATGVSTFSFAALWTAATAGIPLLIAGLVALGAGFSIANAGELKNVAAQLMDNTEELAATSKRAHTYVEQNVGATDKIVEYIAENLSK